jgi:hypothetical protein
MANQQYTHADDLSARAAIQMVIHLRQTLAGLQCVVCLDAIGPVNPERMRVFDLYHRIPASLRFSLRDICRARNRSCTCYTLGSCLVTGLSK